MTPVSNFGKYVQGTTIGSACIVNDSQVQALLVLYLCGKKGRAESHRMWRESCVVLFFSFPGNKRVPDR